MSVKTLRAAIVGAGYISEYHLKAISREANVELVGICDLRAKAAEKLAAEYPSAKVYSNFQTMLDEANLDVVHVLTQPDSHKFLALMAIKSGCHVILEKPVTTNSKDAEELLSAAKEASVNIAVNHNFIFSRPFTQLREVVTKGELGPIKSVRVVWKKNLAQINFGPWNLWMLREPQNILFETGSHSLSELLSVIDDVPKITLVAPRLVKTLPSGSIFHRRWNISGNSGDIAVQIDTSFDQGYEQHFVEVEGLFGVARADIENDFFSVDQPTGRAYDLERLSINYREGKRRAWQAIKTFVGYAGSKLIKSWTGGPYETSMLRGIADCYARVKGESCSKETGIEYATKIAQCAEAIIQKMPKATLQAAGLPAATPTVVQEPTINAIVLIIGASGFIGKRLLQQITANGTQVRAIVRNASSLVGVEPAANCEVMVGDFRDEALISKALQGVTTVVHLAVAHGNSLSGYLAQDSEPTLELANKCLELGIKRFIYTGTIDSLDLSYAHKIKESDGVDGDLKRRNNYAHSKAITESKLRDLHAAKGFPLVILRPAIVLGAGGPPVHVGVANWSGIGRCAYWGNGSNPLPIVLVDDIVTAIISAISAEGIEGNIYNLSSASCISAREYVREVETVLGGKIQAEKSGAFGPFIGDLFKWSIKCIVGHPDKSRVPSLHDWKCRQQHASFDTSAAQNDLGWVPCNDKNVLIKKGIHEPTRIYLDN